MTFSIEQKQALLGAIFGAVEQTFMTCLGGNVAAGVAPEISRADMHAVDIGAIAKWKGPGLRGRLILAFPRDTYLKVVSILTGQEFRELTAENLDGASELLNMVAGHVAESLRPTHGPIDWEIPTVARGCNLLDAVEGGTLATVLPFACDAGRFFIALSGA